jgi:deoxyribodipyrimidine photo-lyase
MAKIQKPAEYAKNRSADDMSSSESRRFCGELRERGIFLERVLVFESAQSRDPQPLVSLKSAPPDALKLSSILDKPARNESLSGDYIVYLMTVQRRLNDNAGLAIAGALSTRLKKPVLIVEAMSGNAPWSSARVHTFVGQGAAWNAAHGRGYVFIPQGRDPRIDPEEIVSKQIESSLQPEIAFSTALQSSAKDVPNASLVGEIVERATAVVCDWASFYIFPDIAIRSHQLVQQRAPHVPFLMVDDVGLTPLFLFQKAEAAARFIRPKLKEFVSAAAAESAGIECLIRERLIFSGQLAVKGELLLGDAVGCENFSAGDYGLAIAEFAGVSQNVPAVEKWTGGEGNAMRRLDDFLRTKISRYAEERNHPDETCSSQLSPWLHFGMIHPRTILIETARHMGCENADQINAHTSAGKFIDELVTWRELGQNMSHFAYRDGVSLGSLQLVPRWAAETLKKFAPPETHQISLADLENAQSPDPVWNAAQRELMSTGVIQNYMRMLWGKGIVRWSNGPEQALQRMEYLNNKYALDGRDPNSYTGIYWCLGKFDRPWPPAREPFGLVRSMTTASAQKKLRMQGYLKTFSNLKSH